MGGSRLDHNTASNTDCSNSTSISASLNDHTGVTIKQQTLQNATNCAATKKAEVLDDLKDQASELLRKQGERMVLLKNTLVDMNDEQVAEISLRNENVNFNAVTKKGQSAYDRNTHTSLVRQKPNDHMPLDKSKQGNVTRKKCKLSEEKPEQVVYAWHETKGNESTNKTASKQFEKSIRHHRLPDENSKKAEYSKKESKEESIDEIKASKVQESDAIKMCPSNNLTIVRTKTNVPQGVDSVLNDSQVIEMTDTSNNKPREPKENEMSDAFLIARSKTMPTLTRAKITQQKVTVNTNEGERLRLAKEMAEKAVKYKRIFTIQGGYATIRQSLRRRGWVEKFYKIPITLKKNPPQKDKKNSDDDDNNNDNNDDDDDAIDDDDDDDIDDMDTKGKVDDQPKVPPWEEEDGIYGIMSRLVRNVNPTLFWVLKRDAIDYRFLTKDQMVNHYCKAGSFTTKVGLCINMRNVVWFDNTDHNTFFPRCYRLSHDEDKDAFVDDYRLTACMCIVKVAVRQHALPEHKSEDEDIGECQPASNPETVISKSGDGDKTKESEKAEEEGEVSPNNLGTAHKKRKKIRAVIPVRVLETAVYQCEKFLASKDHEDIDMPSQTGVLTDQQWDDLIQWYYQLVHEEGTFINVPINLVNQCESLTRRLAQHCPQFEMDGIRNVWIVKPGARSRGRGIICYEKLEDMLKLVSSQVVKKDGKYVVQKYIERPLLIYNTKFDIRQWFLVTDWNPLTLWFYRDSYLRFCSQQFTLEDFDQSIHLSNNAIQKHYKNGPRSPRLPDENMWTHHEFKEYLKNKKQPNAWDEVIYPNMKKAIICSLLVTQDLVEYRKSSFELYGADFMLTEDLTPWLIEINSSPSMESSTAVTAKLCAAVLDDTIKVVIDRKLDRNCDIGAFELAYKQALVTVPPYIGVNLCVEGQSVKKPSSIVTKPQPKQSDQSLTDSLFIPRAVTMRQTIVDRNLEVKKSNVAGDSSPVRSDKSRLFEAATSKIQQPLISVKDISAKVNTFRSSGELDKPKASKLTNVGLQNTSAIESKWNSGIDSLTFAGPNNQTTPKSLESQKSESDSSLTQPDVQESNSKLEDISNRKTTPGTLPNTQYLLGLTQRKFISKKSVSMNYSIPSALGVDKVSQPKSVSVSNVESTDLKNSKPIKGTNSPASSWPRACLLCGRGGGLQLDSADPNCRCQQDSILVTSCTLNQEPLIISSLNLQPTKTKPYIRSKMKSAVLRNSITPTQPLESDDEDQSHNKDVKLLRPSSAHTEASLGHTKRASRIKCNKKRKSIVSSVQPQEALSLYTQPYSFKIQASLALARSQELYQGNSFSYTGGNWQNVIFDKPQPYMPPGPPYPMSYSVHSGVGTSASLPFTGLRSAVGVRASNPHAMVKMWPQLTSRDTHLFMNPLGTMVHRRLQLNVKNSKGVIL